MLQRHFFCLIFFEYLSERRRRSSIASTLLYVGSLLFILYYLHRNNAFDAVSVIALFWVLQLFICVWFCFETFQSETVGRMLFWHQLLSPSVLYLAKSVYSAFVMVVLSSLIWISFFFLFQPYLFWSWQVCIILPLAVCCFSFVFTFLSHLVFVVGKQVGMVGVLGIPIVIPVLFITVKMIKSVMLRDIDFVDILPYASFFLILSFLVVALGVYLIPYVKAA